MTNFRVGWPNDFVWVTSLGNCQLKTGLICVELQFDGYRINWATFVDGWLTDLVKISKVENWSSSLQRSCDTKLKSWIGKGSWEDSDLTYPLLMSPRNPNRMIIRFLKYQFKSILDLTVPGDKLSVCIMLFCLGITVLLDQKLRLLEERTVSEALVEV